MLRYMLTIYRINTTVVTTEAENADEAQRLFDEGSAELAVLTIPEVTYSFVSEARPLVEDDNNT